MAQEFDDSSNSSFTNGTFKPHHNFSHPGSQDRTTSAERPGNSLRPPPPGELSRNHSEADSLLELYHHPNSANTTTMPPKNKTATSNPKNSENSNWVHRDKLIQIEIQEYIDRGMEVPQELIERAELSGQHAEQHAQSASKGGQNGDAIHVSKHRRVESRSQESEDDGTFVPFDPRTPEEIAADPYEDSQSQHAYSHGLRSSSSRIPLSKSSPLPVPQEHLERNTPLQRKRGASGNWDEDGLMYKGPRGRSQSVGSQVLLDDAEIINSTPASPTQASPTKPRQASNTSGTSGARKTSTALRNVSGPKPKGSPAARPTTRDGRPSTAINRPEGDPPWLATMYKPDPRLPPEEQILPTHAKRMMQEQWQKENKPGAVYDQNFVPLSIHPDAPPKSPAVLTAKEPDMEIEKAKEAASDEPAGWPLKQTLSPTESIKSGNAGYSPMPNVKSPKLPQSPHMMNQPPLQSPKLPRPEQTFESEIEAQNKGKKKSGCGCCVIM